MKKKLITCTIGLILFCFSYAQQYNKLNARTKKQIDSTYKILIKKYGVVGLSLAIVDHGEIVYSTGYGFADQKNRIAASDKTIYEINSCTKSFTCLSLLQLHEKGKLKITHSVKEYLPELKIMSHFNDNNPLYINDMMCHVSGLPCDIWNGSFCDEPPPMDWLIGELNKQTTISPRRYKHAYSNIAYDLLAEVVARQGKSSFSNYLKKNIFVPLQMSSSFVWPEEKFLKDLSKAYCNNTEIKEPLPGESGAGGIQSNVVDMAHYLQMLLNNGSYDGKQIISPALLKEMETDQLEDVLLNATERSYGYGLGMDKVWIKTEKDSSLTSIIGHDGGGFAFRSVFRFIPELGVGVVLLTNTDRGEFIWYGNPLLEIYLKEARGKTISYKYIEPIQAVGNNAEAKEIIGQYNLGELLINVKSTNKITAGYGVIKFVFRPKKSDTTRYSGKVLLLGFIPVKKLNEGFAFVKLNGEIYIKKINPWNKKEEFIGMKARVFSIPRSWQEKLGRYKVTGAVFKCTDCPFLVFEGMTLSLSEESGFMVLKTRNKTSDMNNTYYLDVVSGTLAVTGGIGRGTGETVRILDNGNIYYSGFEFEKKKE